MKVQQGLNNQQLNNQPAFCKLKKLDKKTIKLLTDAGIYDKFLKATPEIDEIAKKIDVTVEQLGDAFSPYVQFIATPINKLKINSGFTRRHYVYYNEAGRSSEALKKLDSSESFVSQVKVAVKKLAKSLESNESIDSRTTYAPSFLQPKSAVVDGYRIQLYQGHPDRWREGDPPIRVYDGF